MSEIIKTVEKIEGFFEGRKTGPANTVRISRAEACSLCAAAREVERLRERLKALELDWRKLADEHKDIGVLSCASELQRALSDKENGQ